MIIAHLPAGYLLTKVLSLKFEPGRALGLWICGLTASLLPDLDILWFHIEGGVRNHRYYPTHWPLTWTALFLAAVIVAMAVKRKDLLIYPVVIYANLLFHLLLDCLAGPVFYAAPFFWDRIHLIHVPAVYSHWIWNFLRHWTFQLELMIWFTAALIFSLSSWKKLRCG